MVWYLIEHRIQNDDVRDIECVDVWDITDKMNDKPHDKSNMDSTCLSSFNILTAPSRAGAEPSTGKLRSVESGG